MAADPKQVAEYKQLKKIVLDAMAGAGAQVALRRPRQRIGVLQLAIDADLANARLVEAVLMRISSPGWKGMAQDVVTKKTAWQIGSIWVSLA